MSRSTNTAPPSSERRALARRTTDRAWRPVWIKESSDGDEILHCTSDVGEGGVYLGRAMPRRVGSLMHLELELPDDEQAIAIEGRVVRAGGRDGLGVAVEFVRMSDEDRWRIRRYVREAHANQVSDRRSR